MMAFRSTCRPTTAASPSPLARAVRAKSCPSIWRMLARVIRETTPARKKPVAIEGRTSARSTSPAVAPTPAVGNSRQWRPNASSRTRPHTNTGTETPSSAPTLAT